MTELSSKHITTVLNDPDLSDDKFDKLFNYHVRNIPFKMNYDKNNQVFKRHNQFVNHPKFTENHLGSMVDFGLQTNNIHVINAAINFNEFDTLKLTSKHIAKIVNHPKYENETLQASPVISLSSHPNASPDNIHDMLNHFIKKPKFYLAGLFNLADHHNLSLKDAKTLKNIGEPNIQAALKYNKNIKKYDLDG